MTGSAQAAQSFNNLQLSVLGGLSRFGRDQEREADLLGLREARVVFDKAYLALALERCGSVSGAAEALGLNRSYLSELVKRYGLKRS